MPLDSDGGMNFSLEKYLSFHKLGDLVSVRFGEELNFKFQALVSMHNNYWGNIYVK